uniref:Uncharacterized protein n=2 Tax=Corethron hystrix TaxID=216773 RepID=A0A7S1FQF7_9STRA|mmetsp:Transcript_19508/g.44417  ORF Transcript_19508/g.44417 Transcript_19508/m.44417 type:complete len:188 (+) Transcript_19508:530-1093(+)|eukprot:CAMPEP_0113316210 /NCGR_PEP_ID=MMETSP0010_2-20120614/11563_1 /TAXON_ID=216773 ORGANISM="Corethron hystrix, Strain 308" /NCGR_SAMPLE_ID=MMETSP0010_2 /ASSEMBLY_ACC=CAM_ASM_000155 /LENGTH=187 /DNA_ID=CAMNT_0000172853 /DNA_START=348 /DNA_END=911 /DNA_ORIENTATION=+ /assembly_acc=CAM_ASM_000155
MARLNESGKQQFLKNVQRKLKKDSNVVMKTHSIDLSTFRQLVGRIPVLNGRMLFVRSVRCDHDPQCDTDAVKDILCISFKNLLYDSDAGREEVVAHVASLLKEKILTMNSITSDVHMDETAAVSRVKEMDNVSSGMVDPTKTDKKAFIKNLNFKYQIHVNHRGQSGTWRKKNKITHQEYCDLGAEYL